MIISKGGQMNNLFKIEDVSGIKDDMFFDRKVTFYHDKTGKVEAEYFYLNGIVNYLLSLGFSKESLGEMKKSKVCKTKKPFFSLQKGWFN